MGQSLSLSYSVADCSTQPVYAPRHKQVSYVTSPRAINCDDIKSCSSFCISDEDVSDDESDVGEDLPFYHSESLGLSEYLKHAELPQDEQDDEDMMFNLFGDGEDEEADEEFFYDLFDAPEVPLVFHQEVQEMPFCDVMCCDVEDFFAKESEDHPKFELKPVNRDVLRDIPYLDLFTDLELIPEEDVHCVLCNHKWTVLRPDFNGNHIVNTFEECPKCRILDLDQELNQTYNPQECPICMDECLYDDVTLRCSHAIHEECLKSLLEQKWSTDRINFNFLNCPCCRTSMHDPDDYSHKVNELMRDLDLEKVKKGVDQLAYASLEAQAAEVLAEDVKLEDMNKADQLELAYRKLAFYMCCDCEHPFFGGMVNCVADMEAAQEDSSSNPQRKCLNCSVGKSKAVCGCPLENLIFKCMCCCHPATYHCGGTEFYCDRCHDDLYTAHPCPGPDHCPLGIVHPQNCVGTIGGGKAVTPFALFCKSCGPLGHTWDCEAGEDMSGLDKH